MATLKMAIDARNLIQTAKRVETTLHGVKSAAHTSFYGVKRAADIALGPLKAMVAVSASVKASMIALGAASIGAAGQYEMFNQQLRTVIRTKEEADRAFRESITFSVVTPFTPEQIIRTRLELEAVGVRGAEAVKRVAQAAAGMNREITDVAAAVKSMEVEPLRNLGIMMDELYKRGVSKEFRQSTEEFREAQQVLLDIFSEKYGGGLARMSLTWQGLISTLKGAVFDLRAEFGAGFLDESKLFVQDMIEGAKKLKDYAKEAGEHFGDEMLYARAALLSGFDVALKIAGQIKEAMKQEGGLGTVILEALKLGASILGQGIISAFKVSLSFWKVIGSVLGNAVLDAIAHSNIPGAGYVREGLISGHLQNMEMSQLRAMAREHQIPFTTQTYGEQEWSESAWATQRATGLKLKSKKQLADDIAKAIGEMSVEDQFKYTAYNPGTELESTIKETTKVIETETSHMLDVALDKLQEFENELAKTSGTAPINILKELETSFDNHMQQGKERIVELQKLLEVEDTQLLPESDARQEAYNQKLIDDFTRTQDELAEKERDIAYQRAQIIAQMYSDMGQFGYEYYDAQKQLLDMQLEEWEKFGIEQGLLAEYRSVALKKQLVDSHEGMQVLQRALNQTDGNLSNFIYNMERDFDSFDDHFKDLGRSMVDTFQRAISDMIAKWIMFQAMTQTVGPAWTAALGFGNPLAGIGGGGGGVPGGGTVGVPIDNAVMANMGHTGWNVGMESPSSRRMVSSALFANAPRLHNGLASDEYPAILQRGERVKRRGESDEINFKVELIDRTENRVRAKKGDIRFDGKEFVTQLVIEDITSNGPIAQTLDRR